MPKKLKKIADRGAQKAPRIYFEASDDPRVQKAIQRAAVARVRADKAQAKHLSPEKYSKRKCKHDQEQSEEVGTVSQEAIESAVESSTESIRYLRMRNRKKVAQRAEEKLDKANLKVFQEQARSRTNRHPNRQQRQRIKREYAARWRQNHATPPTSMKGAITRGFRQLPLLPKLPNVGLVLSLGGFVLVFILLFSSCSLLMLGAIGGATISTYPSEDSDMLAAEAAYAAMEAELQAAVAQYQSTEHQVYDEYVFDLDEIGHDPYTLISLLTAYFDGAAWTVDQVTPTLREIFSRQYVLTEQVEERTETAYRNETREEVRWVLDPDTGLYIPKRYSYVVVVPYEVTITTCTITLSNANLSFLPMYLLSEEQLSVYAMYSSTQGNRPDLFPKSDYPGVSMPGDYEDYDVPKAYLEDEVFAAMLNEAEKYLGYPYVWGGTNPTTSFDCSGYVSWVLNHSGWDRGRMGVMALEDWCSPVPSEDAQPGDLVFFIGTYDAPYPDRPSHVGIYVGDGMMIHCGDPISYADINSNYWATHFYGFGRPPRGERET